MDTVARTTPEELRREIARVREDVAASALVLRDRVATLTDVGHWVAKRPLHFVAAAFALGLVIGHRTA